MALNPPLENTVALLARANSGDTDALNQLVERSLPPLRRWARGRLPQWARGLAETQDLVQDAVLRALPRLSTFEARYPGALQAFLRQAVHNHIVDEIRRVKRRPQLELPDDMPDPGESPEKRLLDQERVERYERALKQLKPMDRDAIIARLELKQSYEEVAIALGKPNANAARMTVTRAVAQLMKAMAAETPGH